MTTLLIAVFGSSLLGSLHCVGMCGGFVAFYAAGTSGPERALAHTAYHGGRLVSYVFLGIVAGAIGEALDLAGSFAGLQSTAAILAGMFIALWGALALFPRYTRGVFKEFVPKAAQRFLGQTVGQLKNSAAPVRALTLGLLSTLLPCGWLYAFVITAAGTGSPLTGGLVLLVFWAGSVPALFILAEGVQRLAAPIRSRVPTLSAICLIVVGTLTWAGRLEPISAEEVRPLVQSNSLEESAERLKSLDQDTLPCCSGE